MCTIKIGIENIMNLKILNYSVPIVTPKNTTWKIVGSVVGYKNVRRGA